MKLNDLHTKKKIMVESEPIINARRSSLNPKVNATRFPPPSEAVVADKFQPFDFDASLEKADALYDDGNCAEAYNVLKTDLQRHKVSGLRQQPTKAMEGQSHFYFAGDVDNAKWLNDDSGLGHTGTNVALSALGKLLQRMEGKDGVEVTHPHGDEFKGTVNIGNLPDNPQKATMIGRRIIDVAKSLLQASNAFASIPFYPTSNDRDSRQREVRATVSFAISDSYAKADMILAKTKQYAKYVVIIDSNLINRYIKIDPLLTRELAQLRNVRGPAKVTSSWPAVSEDKMNKMLEAVINQPGCLLLELNPLEIPPEEALKIQTDMEKKREYLRRPAGVFPVECGSQIHYLPLKEPCNSYPL